MNKPHASNAISDTLQAQLEEQVRHDQAQAQRRWFRWGMLTILLTILLAWVGIPAARSPMDASGLAVFALTFGLLLSGYLHWRGYRVMSDAATRTRRDQLLGRLIQEEWRAEAASEKAKRTLTLSDDGELVEVDEYPVSPTSQSTFR